MSNSLNTISIKLFEESYIHVEALRLLASKEQDLIARLKQCTASGIPSDEVRWPYDDAYPLGHLDRLGVQSSDVHVLDTVLVRAIHWCHQPLENKDVPVVYHSHWGICSSFIHWADLVPLLFVDVEQFTSVRKLFSGPCCKTQVSSCCNNVPVFQQVNWSRASSNVHCGHLFHHQAFWYFIRCLKNFTIVYSSNDVNSTILGLSRLYKLRDSVFWIDCFFDKLL